MKIQLHLFFKSIVIWFVILISHKTVYAQFSGGSGTAESPYLISSYNDLKTLSDSVVSVTGAAYRSAVYRVTTNIDASASAGEDGGQGFKPIGSYTARFTGTFHGGGHIISYITINRTTEFTGFFGFIETGGIVDSIGLSNVNITSIHNYNGALAAFNAGTISYSFTSGALIGNNRSGGLVGNNFGTGSISNCYSTCSVNGNFFVGGFLGRYEGGTISNNYSVGAVAGNTNVGGFIGFYSGGTSSNNYWNRETGGVSNTIGNGGDSSGITGKTTEQMKSQSTFTDAGWNFSTVWKSKYNTYPRLKWEQILQGSGTDGNPYLIAAYDDLKWIEDNLSGVYKLVNNINASASASENSDAGFLPVGNNSTPFTGKFRGGGHTISNLTVNRSGTDYVGLFGRINNANALVDSLGLVSANITGSNNTGGVAGYFTGSSISYVYSTSSIIHGNQAVGGVAGSASGSISNCYSIGEVWATGNYAGGLVGAGGQISNSYSICSVISSAQYAGGLIGFASQAITNCYSNGVVIGNIYVGGLAGGIFVSVTKSYSGSSVSGSSSVGGFCGHYSNGMTALASCFWDTQNSGNAAGAGTPPDGAMTGKTTSEMQTQSTFTGWDFTNVWEIVGTNYPRLRSNPDQTLPVELVTFDAEIRNHGSEIRLKWATATEVNNYGFEIQRSVVRSQKSEDRSQNNPESGTLNSKFEFVDFIEGHGNSHSVKEYEFIDKHLPAGKYLYRLKQIDIDGMFEYSEEIEVEVGTAPLEFNLAQNYPNPFNPETVIEFTLPEDGVATLKVFNILGEEVSILLNEYAEGGKYYQAKFNASDLAAGIYIASLRFENPENKTSDHMIKKMLFIK